MSTFQEPTDLSEKMKLALKDNPERTYSPDPVGYAELVDQRLRAIRLIREMDPKRACFENRFRDLKREVAETPGESIRYKGVLEKLREAHEEWRRLEERLQAAKDVIRSTQWLVDLLADPGYPLSEPLAEVAVTLSDD